MDSHQIIKPCDIKIHEVFYYGIIRKEKIVMEFELYAISDIHGDVGIITDWIKQHLQENTNTILFVLGDAGLNFYMDERDDALKKELQETITKTGFERKSIVQVLFVRGNHDARPENCEYQETNCFGGKAYIQKEYPDLIFLKDGEKYEINKMLFFVVGGGFSEDFHYRILNGSRLFINQEYSFNEVEKIISKAETIAKGNESIVLLTHVLPKEILKYTKLQTKRMQQSITEYALQKIHEIFNNKDCSWFCGHYHTRKVFKIEKNKHVTTFQILSNAVEKLHI